VAKTTQVNHLKHGNDCKNIATTPATALLDIEQEITEATEKS
jgi:hypothetical protein